MTECRRCHKVYPSYFFSYPDPRPGICTTCATMMDDEDKQRRLDQASRLSPRVVTSPLVPPGQVFMASDPTASGDGSWTLISSAESNTTIVSDEAAAAVADALTLTPEQIKTALSIVNLDSEIQRKVLQDIARQRSGAIMAARGKVRAILTPYLEPDLTDPEIDGLVSALMAAMADLGGADVKAALGVSGE